MFIIIDWCAKYNILKINIIYYFGWIVSEPHLLDLIDCDVSKSHMIFVVICIDVLRDIIGCFDVIKFTNVDIGEMCY